MRARRARLLSCSTPCRHPGPRRPGDRSRALRLPFASAQPHQGDRRAQQASQGSHAEAQLVAARQRPETRRSRAPALRLLRARHNQVHAHPSLPRPARGRHHRPARGGDRPAEQPAPRRSRRALPRPARRRSRRPARRRTGVCSRLAASAPPLAGRAIRRPGPAEPRGLRLPQTADTRVRARVEEFGALRAKFEALRSLACSHSLRARVDK